MLLENLRREVCLACASFERHLPMSAPGSVSGIDRKQGLMAIGPAPCEPAEPDPSSMAIMDLDGRVVEGALPPSPDVGAHLALYNVFRNIGGVSSAHSRYATMFAQAGRPIPCFGATHANRFHGEIPITRPLRKPEIEGNYGHGIGLAIIERFSRLNPIETPAVLVMQHGPFTWGHSATVAAANNIALEEVAILAFGTLQLNPAQVPIPSILQDRNFTGFQSAGRT